MRQMGLPFRQKLEVGDRVKILGKSVGCDFDESCAVIEGDGFGWITGKCHFNEESVWMVDSMKNSRTGDYFLPEDLGRI